MRGFLVKLYKFNLSLLLVVILLSIVNRALLINFFSPKSITKANIIILGDSHAVTGIDPKEISKSVNYSKHSEHPYFTYYKLKWLIESNQEIKKVIYSIGYHNVLGDETLLLEGWQETMLPTYFPLLDTKSFIKEVGFNKTIVLNIMIYKLGLIHESTLLYAWKALNSELLSQDYIFLGKFLSKDNSHLSQFTIDATVKRHYKNREVQLNSLNIKYIRKIVDYCKIKNIELTIVSTPLYWEYREQIPNIVEVNFDRVTTNLKNEGVTVLNFSSMNIAKDCFGDGDHLNMKGAIVFSRRLKASI